MKPFGGSLPQQHRVLVREIRWITLAAVLHFVLVFLHLNGQIEDIELLFDQLGSFAQNVLRIRVLACEVDRERSVN